MRRLVVVLALLLPMAAQAGELRPLERGSWQMLRQAHGGRPLVVHLWSLTCAPCLAELAEWGRLTRERPGLDLVLVTTDAPDQAKRVASTLARAGLGSAESWAFADPFTERLRFEIDRQWRGELPRTLLIAADGTVERLSGAVGTGPVKDWLDAR